MGENSAAMNGALPLLLQPGEDDLLGLLGFLNALCITFEKSSFRTAAGSIGSRFEQDGLIYRARLVPRALERFGNLVACDPPTFSHAIASSAQCDQFGAEQIMWILTDVQSDLVAFRSALKTPVLISTQDVHPHPGPIRCSRSLCG